VYVCVTSVSCTNSLPRGLLVPWTYFEYQTHFSQHNRLHTHTHNSNMSCAPHPTPKPSTVLHPRLSCVQGEVKPRPFLPALSANTHRLFGPSVALHGRRRKTEDKSRVQSFSVDIIKKSMTSPRRNRSSSVLKLCGVTISVKPNAQKEMFRQPKCYNYL